MAQSSIASRKQKLKNWIDSQKDVAALRKLEKAVEEIDKRASSQEEDYTLPGPPMTKAEFEQRILKAREEVKNGQVTSIEDLKREMESW